MASGERPAGVRRRTLLHTHASGAGETPAPLDGLRPGGGLAGRDLDVDGGADLGVQPDPHLVRAHGLDRVADLAGRPGPLDQVDLLLGTAGPGHRETARDQVVAAVAGRDVYDVTGAAETAHFLGEDELHRCTTHVALLLARRARVRKQRHLAGVLDRRRDVPLVAGAVAGHPPGADLAAV